eukprot:g43739.t1
MEGLSKTGYPVKFFHIVCLLLDKMLVTVLTDGNMTESFKVKTGVKQRMFVIAPTLFSIFIANMLHFIENKLPSASQSMFRCYKFRIYMTKLCCAIRFILMSIDRRNMQQCFLCSMNEKMAHNKAARATTGDVVLDIYLFTPLRRGYRLLL